jgi:hypothetical protein
MSKPPKSDAAEAEAAAQAAAEAQAKAEAEAAEAEAAAKAAALADADAAHQRKVQAKAEKDAKAAQRAAKRAEADRAGRLDLLNELLTAVEMNNLDTLRDDTVEVLQVEHAAELTEDIFSLADITVIRAATLDRTLADWAMEARRQIMALA